MTTGEQEPSRRASITEQPVSLYQVAKLEEYIGKHGVRLFEVMIDYDTVDERLILSGEPKQGTKTDAENVLHEVVRGIKYIYPNDQLDKSA